MTRWAWYVSSTVNGRGNKSVEKKGKENGAKGEKVKHGWMLCGSVRLIDYKDGDIQIVRDTRVQP